MTISKTTNNFAIKRNLYISCDTGILWIFTSLDDSDEPALCYWMNDDGSFGFRSNIDLPLEIIEELPARINDEKHLRQVLDFIGKEINK